MKTESVTIVVPEPSVQTIRLRLKGTNSLIHHRWSEKAKREILEKQMKKAVAKKGIRNPREEFENSLYIKKAGKFTYVGADTYPQEVKFSGVIGMPAVWVKKAMVDAVRNTSGLTMTLVRGAAFVKAEADGLIPLKYDRLQMREDMVRLAMSTADLRYRGELVNWQCEVEVVINIDVLSAEQVVNLLKIAGFSCGLGEWRPQRNGDFGTFEVETVLKKTSKK